MGSIDQKPGMLLVHPRLLHESGDFSPYFWRWTKLHFRDMLNMSSDKDSDGKVTSCLRFARSDEGNGYGHNPEVDTKPMFVYACLVDNLDILKSKAYDDVSRVLNLETTRELGEDEYPVGYSGRLEQEGKEATVFDIVSAKFAVYEDIPTGGGATFQNLPPDLLSPSGTMPDTLSTYLIAVNVGLPVTAGDDMRKISDMLLGRLRKLLPNFIKTYSSLYRWKGREAQPKDHPFTDAEKNAGWMFMICVSGPIGPFSDITEWIPKDVFDRAVGSLGYGVDVQVGEMVGKDVPRSYGIWEGNIFMR
ncbi:hypothetical protein GGP41_005454 [Bipolaris sorokiniana]|uniref:Uncharacterized protein n=2 Tax=Cochliobolus sativus TaxID=45130 RepID=A0A8H5ZKW8_COCSA|nr:uncharacterized protein COCSADRAFT_33834 [Bipolaris sorokiniana ND90Pr]EMD66908.1 hypothetical protein COCSADRAFT_33834 [Bipolaris sorokiniana ND90Pr]KAF5849980.1 hypothetical protein GGP41_005454 [Bipolaris sorokiniana]